MPTGSFDSCFLECHADYTEVDIGINDVIAFSEDPKRTITKALEAKGRNEANVKTLTPDQLAETDAALGPDWACALRLPLRGRAYGSYHRQRALSPEQRRRGVYKQIYRPGVGEVSSLVRGGYGGLAHDVASVRLPSDQLADDPRHAD